jgi:hypothetical protein
MAKPKQKDGQQATNSFQFTLTGLIVFSAFLIIATTLVSNKLVYPMAQKVVRTITANGGDSSKSLNVGPWGKLVMQDIYLERPLDMLGDLGVNLKHETWTFKNLNVDAAKALLARNGMKASDIARLFKEGNFYTNAQDTVVTTSPDFVLSLDSNSRQQLCLGLAGLGVNLFLISPLFLTATPLIPSLMTNASRQTKSV